MGVNNISAIIWVIAILNIAVGFFVYSASKTRTSRAFFLSAVFVALWVTVIGFFISSTTPDGATLLVKLAYFSGVISGEAFTFFFLIYPNSQKGWSVSKYILIILAIVFGYLALYTNNVIADAFYVGGISRWGWHFGSMWYVFPLIFFGSYISGLLVILYKGLRSNDEKIRHASLFIFWGVSVLVIVPTIVNIILPQFGIFSLIWLGPILNITWVVFIGYAILRYEALSIRLIAKKAFIYTIVVVGISLITLSADFLSTYIAASYPYFPIWPLYLLSAVIISSLGYFIWLKLRETDLLKYEFITTATHKFRTPLTHIKWASENLAKAQTPEEQRTQLEYIQSANAKLVELTNLLVNVSDSDESKGDYHMEKVDLSTLARDVLTSLSYQFSMKTITLSTNIVPDLNVLCDVSRVKFIIQTIIENAISYTPKGGAIVVSTRRDAQNAIYSVRDSGIGVAKDELPLVFSKFYRGSQARSVDTEGMGIGLFISKDILTRHHGKIWAESEGPGKGSTFSFSLPLSQNDLKI